MTRLTRKEKGFTLMEVLIAMALLGIVAVTIFSGLATASKAIFIADERATAESLARTQMEEVKTCEYEYGDSPPYEQVDAESPTHPGYFISVGALTIDEGIQQITVTVKHLEKPNVVTLVDYKVSR